MRNQANKPAAHRAEDKGFYIILILCLTVIGISGYVLFFSPSAAPTDRLAVQQTQSDIAEEPALFTAVDERYDVPAVPAAEEPQPAAEPEPEVQQAAAPAEPRPKAWVRPVTGEVLQGFSGEELVYHETLGDWRVHQGTDYVGGAGTRVYAVGDGRIDRITADPVWGTCITLSLAEDRQAVYRGLSERVKVKEGAEVRAGDEIGTVGEAIPAEEEQGAHLHFELLDGGVYIDPEKQDESRRQTAAMETENRPDGIDIEE